MPVTLTGNYQKKSTKWGLKVPNTIHSQYCFNCVNKDKIGLVQIAPLCSYYKKMTIYGNCMSTIKSSMSRQCSATPLPTKKFINSIREFIKDIIKPELDEILSDFCYSVTLWYNHLTYTQQIEIDSLLSYIEMLPDELFKSTIKLFVKSEKQPGVDPKTRAISGATGSHKYILGPITYALEIILKNKFFGYASGMNWIDIGEYVYNYRDGYWHIQSDVSGMDQSVTNELRFACIKPLYDIIADKIWHIPVELFDYHVYKPWNKFSANFKENGKMVSAGLMEVLGTFCSGRSDTKLSNSMIMIILSRYIYEVILKIPKNHYGLMVVGDDTWAAIPQNSGIDKKNIIDAFSQVFLPGDLFHRGYLADYVQYGSGMTVKKLLISDRVDSIDFCSTNCFVCEDCTTVHLTRQPEKFVNNIPWSANIISLNDDQRKTYLNNLYEANMMWCKNLSIFSQYNNGFKSQPGATYSLIGPRKKWKQPDHNEFLFRSKFFTDHDEEMYLRHDLDVKFGKNEAYTMFNRVNNIKENCYKYHNAWLERYGKVSAGDIEDINDEINKSVYNKYDEFMGMTLHKCLQNISESFDGISYKLNNI